MKNTEAIFTILCPVYNKAHCVARCFDSILKQKTKYKYVVLAIDDGSTDESVSVINKYIEKYPDIFMLYKNEKNMKLFYTALRGYSLLKTPYYCVLDPDDYWVDKDCIEEALNFLTKNKKYTMYATNTWKVDVNGEKSKLNNFLFKTKTFDLNKNEFIYTHTSSTFFVNTFNAKELKKLQTYVGTKTSRCFTDDTFRNMLALNHGLAFVKNKCKSVYNFDESGIWSSMNGIAPDVLNTRIFLNAYLFFDCKYQNYLYIAKYYMDRCLQNDKSSFMNDAVIDCYKEFLDVLNKRNLLRKFGYNKNIAFWLPARTFGGYETCFIRLAQYLSDNFDFNVFYVDYKDGTSPEYFKNSKVKTIEYTDGVSINIPDDTTIFAPLTWAHQMRLKAKNVVDTKLCFWWAHPNAYNWLKIRAGLSDKSGLDFIKQAIPTNAISFMDLECEKSCDKILKLEQQVPYLPVCMVPSDKKASEKMISKQEINMAWLGRLDSDKIYSVLNILHNFDAYKTNKKKIVHIIGYGKSEDLIDEKKYPSLKIIRTGKLTDNKLTSYLIKHVDILFGMGASLLEGAKLGIPAVLVKLSEKEFFTDEYINLFDLHSYILGYQDDKTVSDIKVQKMQSILDEFIKNKPEFIAKNMEYLQKNHTISSCACKFLYNNSLSKLNCQKYFYPDFVSTNAKTTAVNTKKVSTTKKRIKVFFYAFLLALAQIPVLDLLQRSNRRLELRRKIDKWWR